jgi:uncharacterized protein (DUF1330 family)
MTAYVVVEVEVNDTALYEQYKPLAAAAVAAYGGWYLARGGKTVLLEGEKAPERLVILEFESVERALAWWNSPEYAEAKKMRQAASHTRMVVVEGLGG